MSTNLKLGNRKGAGCGSLPPQVPVVGRLDRRGAKARQYQVILEGYRSDRGGDGRLSHGQEALCVNAAGFEYLFRQKLRDLLDEDMTFTAADIKVLLDLSSEQRGLIRALGLERDQLDVTPDLAEIIEKHSGKSG